MAATGSGPWSKFESWGRKDLRASDAEREAVVESLRQHAGEGRLTLDELTQRIQQAADAKTVGELEAVQRDLPRQPRPGTLVVPGVSPVVIRGQRRRRPLMFTVLRLAIINAALIVIWAFTGQHTFSGFWPIWPILISVIWLALRGLRTYERSYRARSSGS